MSVATYATEIELINKTRMTLLLSMATRKPPIREFSFNKISFFFQIISMVEIFLWKKNYICSTPDRSFDQIIFCYSIHWFPREIRGRFFGKITYTVSSRKTSVYFHQNRRDQLFNRRRVRSFLYLIISIAKSKSWNLTSGSLCLNRKGGRGLDFYFRLLEYTIKSVGLCKNYMRKSKIT